ncbi:tape measure protein [Vibrio parahaemolyticus]|nr:tape measure protein [Vibrio parahaemolyticus]EJG1394509.1 tape measure protein [Vibrio parahaemolyticus]EJG1589908.1 tape measure protein [Vibrio parahaemolyticus]EJG1593243.1 tape measure protein [Vibrio parahaemolyticus]EKK9971159.1 tape measure protein [Vibrio parahaemolyticus]
MSTLGSKSQAAFQMMDSSARAASQGIDTFGNRAILGAGAVAIAFERTFVKTAAEFERYQIMLNKLQGSEEGGARAMQWIEDFTQNTPYAVNEVTQAFVKLKAFGLDPMDGTMQAIADQASMMGGTAESVEGIALALGQAWTKGKLQGEEALQLLERGVPVWDYLVKASKELGHNNGLGLTAAQLQDMASKGELGRDVIKRLIEEMGKASEGSAKKQMETWSGMVSNMGDHWSIFQKDVMESGAFDVLKDELGGFLAQLDEMKKTGEYDEFVEKVGKDLVNGFRAAAEAAREIKEAGQEIMPVIRQITNMTAALIDAVGGYGNLAKILASVYAVNKAIRIGSPLLKAGGAAGGFILDKVRGGKGVGGAAAAANALGATPVYVVNMPAGGLGMPDGPAGSKPGKTAPKGKWWTGAAIAANSAIDIAKPALRSAGPAAVLMALGSAKEYDPNNPMFKAPSFGPSEKPKRVKPETEEAMKRFNKAFMRPDSPWAVAGGAPNGTVNLKVEVSDDRIKVTPTSSSPTIKVDPDLGTN